MKIFLAPHCFLLVLRDTPIKIAGIKGPFSEFWKNPSFKTCPSCGPNRSGSPCFHALADCRPRKNQTTENGMTEVTPFPRTYTIAF